MSGLGSSYTTVGPEPAGFIGRGSDESTKTRKDRYFDDTEGDKDPRVKWAKRAASILKDLHATINPDIKRNWQTYRGSHWDLTTRAPWKTASKLNYGYWVVESWTALLTDQKPRCVFSPYNIKDTELASIATAAWNEWYEQERAQELFELAVQLSQIEMVSYLHPYYDPHANNNEGSIKAKNVSVEQLFLDKRATSVRNANIILYEYIDTRGSVLAMYPDLAGKLKERDEDFAESGVQDGSKPQSMVPSSTTTPTLDKSLYTGTPPPPNPTTFQQPSYAASAAPPEDWLKEGIAVQEFWTRPKGPEYDIEVRRTVYTAGNEAATRVKKIEFEDGRQELLQRVFISGVIYELPMSTTMLFQYISDLRGGQGFHVEKAYDALEVVTEVVKVPMYPNGRRLVIVGDYVADDRANPFAHRKIPFVEIHANKNAKDAIGTCPLSQICDPQDYLNKVFSLVLDAILLTANPIWRLPLSEEISDDDLTNAPGAIQRESPQSLKIGRREPGPDMPSYVMQTLQFTIQEIKTIAGLTEISMGGKFKGQVASETVSMMQEQAGIRFRKAMKNVELAVIEFGEMWLGLVGQFYSQPRMLRVRNMAGVERSVSFVGTHLRAPMKMLCKSGSMLPSSPSARLNFLLQSADSPWSFIPQILHQLEEVGFIESASQQERQMEEAMNKFLNNPNPLSLWKFPGLMRQIMGGGPKGGGKNKGQGGRSAKRTTPNRAA